MDADDLLELSAGIHVVFRTCICSSSDVARPFLPSGELGSPDDFRTFFPEQNVFLTKTRSSTLRIGPNTNLQPKGVHSSNCGDAFFSLPCSFALAEAASFSLRRRWACTLDGLFSTSARHERATVHLFPGHN